MSFIADSITSEGLLSGKSIQRGTLITTVASNTQALTAASEATQVYQGTVAGQIVKMPDATTLVAAGQVYELINDSTQNITVQDSAAGSLFMLGASQRATIRNLSVASAAGIWTFTVSTKTASGKTDFETTYPGTGLSVNYVGGVFRFNGALTQVAGGTIALPASVTGTLYVDVDGVIKATASLPDGAMPLYTFVTTGSAVTTLADAREDYDNNATYGVVGDISAVTKSNTASAGVLNKMARADHVHAATLPQYASGSVPAASFTGTPRTATVTFSTPFASANYTVTVTSTDDGRSWKVPSASMLTTGFTINSQANAALTGPVMWQAVMIGQSV